MSHLVKRTIHQNKVLNAIISRLNIGTEVKQDLVYQFTNGREISSAKMSFEECQALINHLNNLCVQMAVEKRKIDPAPTKPVIDPENNMRRKVLSICHEMGWKLENGKIDMARVNAFCVERGFKHKELNKYTRAELPTLITQFEKTLKDYYAKKQI